MLLSLISIPFCQIALITKIADKTRIIITWVLGRRLNLEILYFRIKNAINGRNNNGKHLKRTKGKVTVSGVGNSINAPNKRPISAVTSKEAIITDDLIVLCRTKSLTFGTRKMIGKITNEAVNNKPPVNLPVILESAKNNDSPKTYAK